MAHVAAATHTAPTHTLHCTHSIHLQNTLDNDTPSAKHSTPSNSISNHIVINIIQSINDSTDTLHNRVTAMKKFTHMDNIHLTAEGYKKLADSVIAAAQSMMSRPHPVPAARKGIEKVHWHGFTVPALLSQPATDASREPPPPHTTMGGGGVTTPTTVYVRPENAHVQLASAGRSWQALPASC